MKNRFVFGAVLAAAVMMTGCASQESTAVSLPQAERVVENFQNAGYEVKDVNEGSDSVSFSVVDEHGGANVEIFQYADAAEAENQFNDLQAEMTQSDYYMNNEESTESLQSALFTNSINYNNGILINDKASNTVIVVKEIAQENLEYVIDALASYGLTIQA